ncbi:MAG: DUF4102 domain-containing protein, partial [Geminicoccaceae bacterium]
MPKLTKRTVDALQPDPVRRLFIFDDDLKGFGVSVTTSGTKSYFVEYRPGAGGRKAPKWRVTIGRHGSPWTVDGARAEARRLLALVAGGADPASDKAEARKGPGDDYTVAAVAGRFVREHVAKLRPWTRESYEGIIRRRIVTAWGDRALDTVTRRDVARLVDGIAQDHPVMGRLSFAVTRSFFGWCCERSLLDANPCDGMKGPAMPKAR